MKKKKVSAKRTIRDMSKMLVGYRKQLLARHRVEPLKSPPLFLLDLVIATLERTAEELL